MAQALVGLRRAGRIRATRHRFAGGTIDVGAADGASLRHFKFALAAGTLGEYRANDARYYVAGARHQHVSPMRISLFLM